MEEIDLVRKNIKNKRTNESNTNKQKINNFISRFLIATIIFMSILILSNLNKSIREFIKKEVLTNHMSFTYLTNCYNKYFGNIIPIKDVIKEETTVFNEHITYKELKDYKDGYELKVTDNYLIPVINSGIVVYIGEKEDYGNTVIIQGIDEIDYWYGNVDNISLNLYDYVTKGTLLASSKDDKLYLVFQKKGKYLDYGEVME